MSIRTYSEWFRPLRTHVYVEKHAQRESFDKKQVSIKIVTNTRSTNKIAVNNRIKYESISTLNRIDGWICHFSVLKHSTCNNSIRSIFFHNFRRRGEQNRQLNFLLDFRRAISFRHTPIYARSLWVVSQGFDDLRGQEISTGPYSD